LYTFFFIWIRGNPTPRKTHFMDPGERVKSRLSQTLIKSARPNWNSRPAVQIWSPLPSFVYRAWIHSIHHLHIINTHIKYITCTACVQNIKCIPPEKSFRSQSRLLRIPSFLFNWYFFFLFFFSLKKKKIVWRFTGHMVWACL
jgi:hypothetical protein